MDSAGDVSSRVDPALRQAAQRAYEAAHGVLTEESPESEPPRWRWRVSPRVGVTLAVVTAIIGALVVWAPRPSPVAALIPPAEEARTALPTVAASLDVTVHIAGAVRTPGVYVLPAGSRVTDAIDAAGGAEEEAVTDAINLARPLVDGEQVRVPSQGEASAHGTASGDDRINVNTATASQLEGLPGVGPVLAQRIVEYRERHGPFASLKALEAVSGVGPSIVSGLSDVAAV
jgi:competence protein ComEA